MTIPAIYKSCHTTNAVQVRIKLPKHSSSIYVQRSFIFHITYPTEKRRIQSSYKRTHTHTQDTF